MAACDRTTTRTEWSGNGPTVSSPSCDFAIAESAFLASRSILIHSPAKRMADPKPSSKAVSGLCLSFAGADSGTATETITMPDRIRFPQRPTGRSSLMSLRLERRRT